RDAALDRDRALPHGDRTASRRRADRDARRAARRDTERGPRPLGHPRLRPLGAGHARALAAELPRLVPALLGCAVAGRDAPGGARADDHDHPDHVGYLPRAVLAHATRPDGRGDGARVDALGGDPGRHVRLRRPGDRRGGAARPGPRVRRGDRRQPGDRRRQLDPHLALRPGGLPRLADRGAVPGRDIRAAGELDPLPRRDPDGHLTRDERPRTGDRAAVRAVAEGVLMTTIPSDDRYDITVRSAGLRRRKLTEKAFAGLAVASAVIAVAILAVVLGTVIHRGLSALSLDFFTKPRPLFGQAGGIADALVGSALIVGMAMVMAIPFSILVAIFMSEYAGPRLSVALRIVLDVLNGVPAIVVGIFVLC